MKNKFFFFLLFLIPFFSLSADLPCKRALANIQIPVTAADDQQLLAEYESHYSLCDHTQAYLYNLALLYQRNGLTDKAYAIAEQCLNLGECNHVNLILAKIAINNQEYSKAKVYFNLLLSEELSLKNEAIKGLVYISVVEKNYLEAGRQLDNYVGNYLIDPVLGFYKVIIDYQQKKYNHVIALYKQVSLHTKYLDQINALLLDSYYQLLRYKDILTFHKLHGDYFRKHPEKNIYYANSLFFLGQNKEAIDAYSGLLKLETINAADKQIIRDNISKIK